MGGMASISGINCVTSLRCPPVSVIASGVPCVSVIRWCLEPGLRRSTGLGPGWSPCERAQVRGVHQRGREVQQARRAKLGEQQLVQLLPDPGLVPLGQPPPTGSTRGIEQGGGQPVPADTGTHYIQNALQCGPVVGPLAAGMAKPPRTRRNQRLQARPQLVGQDLFLTHPSIVEHRAASAKPARHLILN